MILKMYYNNEGLEKITRTERKNKETLRIIKIHNSNRNLHSIYKERDEKISEELRREITRYYLDLLPFGQAVELNVDSKKGGTKLQEYINETIGYDFL